MDILLSGLLIIIVLAVLLGSIFWAFDTVTDYGSSITHRAVSIVVALVVWSLFLGWIIEHEQEYPCVKYEEIMQYNAATKTMMPMRVCVERGEWVDRD